MLCDLHLHTTKSDGVWTPERLFGEVRARELRLFSITDHDCLDAYPVPRDLQDRCLPGLEVDSHHAGHTVHLLAYGIEDRSSPLLQALGAQRAARKQRMVRMVERLNSLEIDICYEDVAAEAAGATSLGRPHLARALVAKGHVSTVQEAFDQYLADNGEGYVELERLTAEEIMRLVHASGGFAVIAHPMRLRARSALMELCDLGADGIEVVHPTAGLHDEADLRAFARQRGLLVTGGTDFHAPVPGRSIGVELEERALELLRSTAERRSKAAS